MICCIIASLLLIFSGCSSKADVLQQSKEQEPISQTRYDLMDTVMTISVYQHTGNELFDDAFNRLADIANRMTIKDEQSELIEVARMSGKSPVKVSDDTFYVIENALKISQDSDGAFDVTVGPLVKLWGIGTDKASVPTIDQIKLVLDKVNYKDVVLDEADKSVYLKREGMMIDLGGIAKGYGGDEAAAIVKERGINSAICDVGGNIVAVGSRPDGSKWRVGIRNPIIDADGYIGVVSVKDKAVVTSGGYERYFEQDGVIYNHILDPSTGFPSDLGLLSVTIVCNSSITADMLSTAVFVLGIQEGEKLLEEYGAQAIFITKDKKVYITSGLTDDFILKDPQFELIEDYA